jgi:hypothetical protein
LPVVHRADIHKLEGVVTLPDVFDAYGIDRNSEPERLLSFRGFLIRILCHLSYFSAKSSDCRNNAIHVPGRTQ